MSPSGRASSAPAAGVPAPVLGAASALGKAFRALAQARLPSLAVGCGARRSPGKGSVSTTSGASGSEFLNEANGAGVARAASTARRTRPSRSAPSATLPLAPSTLCSRGGATPGFGRVSSTVPTIAAARASFMPRGARPAWSRPYATSGCESTPCAHLASRNGCRWGERAHFHARAPSAHCANVTGPAPTCSNAPPIRGRSHIGAWPAMRGYHAGPPASP
eukprot:5887245-Pleurochrysis_carterae.AAC.2